MKTLYFTEPEQDQPSGNRIRNQNLLFCEAEGRTFETAKGLLNTATYFFNWSNMIFPVFYCSPPSLSLQLFFFQAAFSHSKKSVFIMGLKRSILLITAAFFATSIVEVSAAVPDAELVGSSYLTLPISHVSRLLYRLLKTAAASPISIMV